MGEGYRYKVLIVDNEAPSGFRVLCPETGIELDTKVFSNIDDALDDLRVPAHVLNRSIVGFRDKPRHSYDIILLDFEMNENKLVNRPAGEFQLEYPLGGLTLLPLYQMSFSQERRGSCVVQGYSKVMWQRCPKAAAVYELIANLNFRSDAFGNDRLTVEPNNVEGIPIGRLIEKRASSILSSLPVDILDEMYELSRITGDAFWSHGLVQTAGWLNCKSLTFRDLRPDMVNDVEARGWLMNVIGRRAYPFEAKRCWSSNLTVKLLGHAGGADEKRFKPREVYQWAAENNCLEVYAPESGTFRVCPELWEEIRSFPSVWGVSALPGPERAKRLHVAFRMVLGDNAGDACGYELEDVLKGGELGAGTSLPRLGLRVKKAGDGWSKDIYLYMHRRALYALLSGLEPMVRWPGLEPDVLGYASRARSRLYFIAFQNCEVDGASAEGVLKRVREADTRSWGPYPLLSSWGKMELWSRQSRSFEVTAAGVSSLEGARSVFRFPDVEQYWGQAMSAVGMVLPLDVGDL
jgi:hypothetical protein